MTKIKDDASILIILMGSIGDVVRGLSLLSPLKATYPRVRVTWLVETKCEALVRMHENIDDVIVFEREKPLWGLIKLLSELHRRTFDITLDMQRHFKSGLFSFFSGATRRIGFHWKNTKEGNWIFNNEKLPFVNDTLNKFHHYFKFLEHLGVKVENPSPIISNWKLESSPMAGSGEKNVGLVLSSSWESKNWPDEYYESLVTSILKVPETKVILIGDSSCKVLAERLVRLDQNGRIQDFSAKLNLSELAALIGKLSVCVGPDSGPGHIAAAVNTSYIALFGPTSEKRTAPVGSKVKILRVELPCAPCYRRKCPGLGQICMKGLKPDMVFETLRPYLMDIGSAKS
ncbi:MAG: glycosyltransferase family 9 protein [SAR324 cluster bacterium]|uniref:Glycosyltransferase family 9 protein n=1 Tax=SAR324 cluster bacterium TaxID=2024889 RepID=A0A7X9IKR1_9DELT|nr:glycosyltransferase family 9 protein [SAR324 cluster bacterium]